MQDDTDLFPSDRQPAIRVVAMPKDTNAAGHIFGGWIMAQMDLAGSVAAVEYANSRVVTVAVTSMEFHKPVFVGDLVSCFVKIEKIGRTSLTVRVEVFAQRDRAEQVHCVKVTEAVIVYVAVNSQGQTKTLPSREPGFGNYL
ncbi:MAG: acyl-CoA thioesterase [Candidatus Competibacteraceae bacterium]|jgi:acyl-CoA thioesterase YciA|nr:acyl-CoA thioesterase [Candidatus Competibacteraceae bacterium]